MKKNTIWIIRILLLIAYCIPYSFLAVNGDATSGTMLFYCLMIIAFAVLCMVSIKTHNAWIVVIGSILSGVFSYLVSSLFVLKEMSWYFKPFTAHGLVVVISVIAFLIQMVLVFVYLEKRGRKKS